ncbi:MAG: HAD family phosphatase [Nitriliruptoraceae bacterium]|nr:HAD family phosphatase [Nitriliruptoraceae bacterium]
MTGPRRERPSRIRLIATDVDGTLLGPDHRVPADRAAAVGRLQAAGVPVVLATGKIWPSIRPVWEQLELAGPHVTCNGAAVVSAAGELIDCTPLDTPVAVELVDELRRLDVPHAVYLEDGSLVTSERVDALDIVTELGEPEPTVATIDGRRVLKVLAVVDEHREGGLRTFAGEHARTQRTGPRFLEWNSPAADKATGLRVAVSHLGLALASVVAIGDAENDIPMLRAAGFGVAVAGASDVARDAADLHLRDDLARYLDEVASAAIMA